MPEWPADRVERRPIASLIPYARNARTHSDAQVAQIAASIREWGWTTPVLVDTEGGIIAGHGRVLAARQLGLADVPVMVAAGWSEAQRRAYVLADNKLALNAGWDAALLGAELKGLGELGFDVALTGFSADELAALTVEQNEGLTDPDDVPEPLADAVSMAGDVWLLGRHRLVCGNARSADDWARLMITRPAMTFTSPPYGVGDSAKLRDHYVPGAVDRKSLYATHADSPDDWLALMHDWTALAIAETDCVACNAQMLARNKRNLFRWATEYLDHLIDVVVWDKGHGPPQMQRNVLTNAFEWIFLFSSDSNASRSIPMAAFHGTESNVVRVVSSGKNSNSDVHRATMPVDLANWAIRLTPDASCVVDPFGGTGTTMISAESHGKSARLIEMDPQYVDVAVRRWQQFTGQVATLERTGEAFDERAKEAA